MTVAAGLGVVVGILTALTMGLALVGLAVRYVLVPYLKTQLIAPVQETHKAVTVNGGTSETPTLLDKIGSLQSDVCEIDRKLDDHITWHAHH